MLRVSINLIACFTNQVTDLGLIIVTDNKYGDVLMNQDMNIISLNIRECYIDGMA